MDQEAVSMMNKIHITLGVLRKIIQERAEAQRQEHDYRQELLHALSDKPLHHTMITTKWSNDEIQDLAKTGKLKVKDGMFYITDLGKEDLLDL